MIKILNMIDTKTLYTAVALLILMAVNIILGSLNAIAERNFDRKILLQGIIKAITIIGCFVLVYAAGLLTFDLAIININGEEVNTLTAIYLLIVYSFYYYGREVILKLKDKINSKVIIEEKQDTVNNKILI